jgi:Tol biopolymer transport system component
MFLSKRLHKVLSRLARHPRSPTRLRCHRARLTLERLEERVVPSAITFEKNGGIYIMDEMGHNGRQLTTGYENYDLSPDGTQIIYSYNPDAPHGAAAIWTLNLAKGSVPFKLTDGYSARWSPNGDQIVYAGRLGDKYGIITMYVGVDAQAVQSTWVTTRLTDHGPSDDNAPDWSRDGNQIVFTSTFQTGQNRYLWIMDVADPLNAHKILDPQHQPIDGNAPSWKNGPNIVFGHKGISTVNPDGTGLTQLRSSGGHPYWSSPDGSQIAFDEGPSGHSSIYKMDADGKNAQRLGDGSHPSWSVSSSYFPYRATARTHSTSTNDLGLATDTVAALRAGRFAGASLGSGTLQPNQSASSPRPLTEMSLVPTDNDPRVGSGPVSFHSLASGTAAVDVVLSAWDSSLLDQMFVDPLPGL